MHQALFIFFRCRMRRSNQVPHFIALISQPKSAMFKLVLATTIFHPTPTDSVSSTPSVVSIIHRSCFNKLSHNISGISVGFWCTRKKWQSLTISTWQKESSALLRRTLRRCSQFLRLRKIRDIRPRPRAIGYPNYLFYEAKDKINYSLSSPFSVPAVVELVEVRVLLVGDLPQLEGLALDLVLGGLVAGDKVLLNLSLKNRWRFESLKN